MTPFVQHPWKGAGEPDNDVAASAEGPGGREGGLHRAQLSPPTM